MYIILFIQCASIKLEVSGRTASFQWGTLWGEEEAACAKGSSAVCSHRLQGWDRRAGQLGSRTPVLSVSLETSQMIAEAKEDNRRLLNSLILWRNRKSLVGLVEKVDRCDWNRRGQERRVMAAEFSRWCPHRRLHLLLPPPTFLSLLGFSGLSCIPVCSRNRVSRPSVCFYLAAAGLVYAKAY